MGQDDGVGELERRAVNLMRLEFRPWDRGIDVKQILNFRHPELVSGSIAPDALWRGEAATAPFSINVAAAWKARWVLKRVQHDEPGIWHSMCDRPDPGEEPGLSQIRRTPL